MGFSSILEDMERPNHQDPNQDSDLQGCFYDYSLVVMNVKNVFFKSALKTFFSYFSVLNDKNV